MEKIDNQLMEALMKTKLSPNEWQLILCILQYARKKPMKLSYKQIEKHTRINIKHIPRVLKKLRKKNMISIVQKEYAIQKDYTQWQSGKEPLEQQEKYTQTGVKNTPEQVEKIHQNGCKKTTRTGVKKPPERVENKLSSEIAKKNTDIKTFIDWWFQEYQKRFGKKYFVSGGKEGTLIKKMLQSFDIEYLKELAIQFFNSNDEFILRSGFTIGVFYGQLNRLQLIGGKTFTKHTLKNIATFKEILEEEDKKNDQNKVF